MMLHEVINSLSTYKDFQHFYQHVYRKSTSISFAEKHIIWYPPLLIFPEDEPSGCYSEEEKRLPFFVAGCFYSQMALGESGIIEEDSVFRYYFTAGWSNSDCKKALMFYEHLRVSDSETPIFSENLQEFRSAISDLMMFINRLPTVNHVWADRLNTVLEMLDAETDYQHIFHLAGLYDIESLWMSLTNSSLVCPSKFEPLKRNYIQQLHRYVMYHVNAGRMNDIEIEPLEVHDTTATTPAFAIIQTSQPEDYKWLCYIYHNTLPEHVTEPTYVNDILPVDWMNDIEAMQKAFEWESDEQQMLSEARDESASDLLGSRFVDILRQLVRKRLRQEAVKEFEERKMQWMYYYNR